MPLWMLCLNPWVIDGDSIRCSNLGELRLLGIDAPDFTDSPPCAAHYGDHVCNDAGDRASTRSLIALKRRSEGQQWRVRGYGRDRYGRLIADVRIASPGPVGVDGPGHKYVDLSCFQLANGSARYIAAYDGQRVIARECRLR